MAVEQAVKKLTLPSAGDLSSSQYRFVKLSSGKVAACGDGEAALGVLCNDPAAADRDAVVAVNGQVKVEVGGTVTQDGWVGSDSVGRAVDAASGDYLLGQATEAATTAGERISITLKGRPGTL